VSKYTYLELKETYEAFFDVLAMFNDTTVEEKVRQTYYPLMLALCEKAHVLYTELLESGTPEALNALYTVYYPINNVNMTMDQAYSMTREFFCNILVFKTISVGTTESSSQILLWVLYANSSLRPFMVEVSDLMYAHLFNQEISAELVTKIMADFRSLNPLEQNLFFMFGFQLYYDSLMSHFAETDTTLASLITAILQAEIGYVTYVMDPEDSGRVEFFKTCMEPAIAAYDAFTDKDKLPEDVKKMYEYYLEAYSKIK
jgi:hypothetical protein